jgi:hypothetical protein
MTTPEVGSLWIDNDPRNRATRFVRVDAIDHSQPDFVRCTTWYDEPSGTETPRRNVAIKISRLDSAARANYRAADAEPRHGTPSPA